MGRGGHAAADGDFFPLFTLLEDLGVLPRIAFNLDKGFARCNACGKQALTMCMGFGCNAAGVVGCRIISGKRERLIAILTNSFVPCNGRFPMLIALISLFLQATAADPQQVRSRRRVCLRLLLFFGCGNACGVVHPFKNPASRRKLRIYA